MTKKILLTINVLTITILEVLGVLDNNKVIRLALCILLFISWLSSLLESKNNEE